MIELLVDNNALQFICAHSLYHELELAINAANLNQVLRVHFHPTVFCERLLGVHSDNMEIAQKEMRKASKLCKKSIMLDPVHHLRICLSRPSDQIILNSDRLWREKLTKFCNSRNYSEIEDIFKSDVDSLGEYRADFLTAITGRIQHLVGHYSRPENRNFRNFRGEKDSLPEELFYRFIDFYGLRSLVRHIPGYEVERKLVSLKYLTDAYIYYVWQGVTGRIPKASDYDDLEQFLYLNICDYIVTADKNMKEIMNRCTNEDLRGRFIDTCDFVNAALHNNLNYVKRAPFLTEQLKSDYGLE